MVEVQDVNILDGIFDIKSYKPAQWVTIYYISVNIHGT